MKEKKLMGREGERAKLEFVIHFVKIVKGD